MIRRRRISRPALLAGLTVVALAALLITRGGAESKAPAELASDQWQRLASKMARATKTRLGSGATADGLVESGPSGGSSTTAPSLPGSRTSRIPAGLPSRAPLAGDVLEQQAAEYEARRPKSVIELQQFRRTSRARVVDERGRAGQAVLINLSPRVNFWYLLQLTWDGEATTSYHLTNSRPLTHELALDPDVPGGLVLESSLGRTACALWSSEATPSLEAAARLSAPYVALCSDDVVLRRPTAGRRTRLEWATDFLRDRIWGGETITVLVRDTIYQDSHLVTSDLIAGAAAPAAAVAAPGRPGAARIESRHAGDLLTPVALGLALESPRTSVQVGAWYPARGNPGVFVSVLRPGLVAVEAADSGPRRTGRLDAVEADALTYLVAFDLSHFEIDFSVGTDHPRVGWADRVQPGMRDASLPGPDGFADLSPLVAGGIVPYSLAEHAVASFTGGFKRSHGAFRSGALGERGSGSHYGFVESGVVLSKLHPGLATVFALDDGAVTMKTWSRDDDALLERIRFARQNGVPIVETDAATGQPVPGALVGRWGDGNWSGSQDRRLRTVRAGICLQESAAGRFLLYGYFSSATPTAMARVFLAYDCSYAMITDMNALEHTYLALYRVEASRLAVDHLVEGMEVLDQVVDGQTLPRFLGFADNRDFFYVVRRQPSTEREPESPGQELALRGRTEAR